MIDVAKKMKSSFNTTKQRCYNPKCRDFKYYGGRGITICDRWLESFDNLIIDMGLRPEGMTLERKDNDGPYSPENCYWATRSTQSSNTRACKLISYEGETHSVAEWERVKGFTRGTLKARLGALGYTMDEAFTKPVRFGLRSPNRQYKVRKSPDMSRVPRGLTHSATKFSAAQVMDYRKQYQDEPHTFTSLARLAGVSIETMSQLIQGHGAYQGV